ncbi:Adenine specific DNA methylase Mod [Bacteroidales bacterium Barb4]|nr:Adenine specific DNA methylase Mod [Bacteroidales bacterium Barb4]
MTETFDLFSIKEASEWATQYLGKHVTAANITYLVNYGKIAKIGENGLTLVSRTELLHYYKSYHGKREIDWKEKLGDDLNWALSFDYLKESDTTKHVHRLHPYKGKFIPQLVEYFLDSHTDSFKIESYFQKGDIVLDPFCGSGTTLVQAGESGLHGIGIDVSAFNALISNCKVLNYDLQALNEEIDRITAALSTFIVGSRTVEFEQALLDALNTFNNQYFPVPEFKRKVQQKLINGEEYGQAKAKEFLPVYWKLVNKYGIELLQPDTACFLGKWYSKHIRKEIDFVFEEIKKTKDTNIKKILSIILSRTMRSCRATTHADLATLKEPVTTTYYCAKHGKICKPLFSMLKWWQTYSKDAVKRLLEFSTLRSNTFQYCITGDSRTVDIFNILQAKHPSLYGIANKQKIRGIFSSPPYVGLIDYHEQHAYSYDLFGFERKDDWEIGPLYKGQGKAAKENYAEGISDVLINCKRYLVDNYDIFLVANDKYGLYPQIAERAGMQIANQYKRPVLNRTEKDKGAYSEIIFHLKKQHKV